jgi:hypothetical protein
MSEMRRNSKSNHLVRLMISNWALGWGVGFACAAAVLLSNVGGLRIMMFKSNIMLQALALLFGGFGMFFGGVVCATAVMLLPIEEQKSEGGGRGAPVLLPAYAMARIRRPRG